MTVDKADIGSTSSVERCNHFDCRCIRAKELEAMCQTLEVVLHVWNQEVTCRRTSRVDKGGTVYHSTLTEET
jgi:hypothetical protein